MLPERAFQRIGGRMTLEGGSGGGSSSTYYGNMDRLYGVQSQAAQYMLDNSMPYIPQYMSNSSQMVAEANNGSLNTKMRNIAEDNATAAAGQSTEAMNQNLARYGVNPNSGAFADMNLKNSVGNAASTAKAKNDAGMWVEDQKWNRNAGALGQATGMGTGAMQATGQAATGYGAAGGNTAQYGALNASGYGKFGSAVANSAFKDGGEVKNNKPGLHLAMGGAPSNNPWVAYQNNNPIQTTNQSNDGSGAGAAIGSLAMGAAPIVLGKGMKAGLGMVKDAWNKPADEASKLSTDKMADLSNQGRESADRLLNPNAPKGEGSTPAPSTEPVQQSTAPVETAPTADPTPVADATANTTADTAVATGTDAAAVTGADAATAAGTEAVVDAGVNGGAALANIAAAGAAEAGAVEAGATVGSVVPGVGTAIGAGVGALAAIGMSEGWSGSTGGKVKKNDPKHMRRKDMRPGGDVAGQGTETSDDIPAWLSDGEHVQNATSVKLAGLDTLEKINKAGLNVREGKQDAQSAQHEIGQEMIKRGEELTAGLHMACGGKVGVKMAGGGFLGNAGIMLGSATDEWDRQRNLKMKEDYTNMQTKLNQPYTDTVDEATDNRRSQLKTQTAQNDVQQQNLARSENTASIGYIAKNLGAGNNAGAIDEANKYFGRDEKFAGRKVTGFTPGNGGVNAVFDDGTEVAFSNETMKQGIQHVDNPKYTFMQNQYTGDVVANNQATGTSTPTYTGRSMEGRNKTPVEQSNAEYWHGQGQLSPSERTSREKAIETARKGAMPGEETAAAEQAAASWDSQYSPFKNKQPAPAPAPSAGTVSPGVARLIGAPAQPAEQQPAAPAPKPAQKPVSVAPVQAEQVAEAPSEPEKPAKTGLSLADVNRVAPRSAGVADGRGLDSVRTAKSGGSHNISDQRAKSDEAKKQHNINLAKSDYENAKADYEYAKPGSTLKEPRKKAMEEAKAKLDKLTA